MLELIAIMLQASFYFLPCAAGLQTCTVSTIASANDDMRFSIAFTFSQADTQSNSQRVVFMTKAWETG